MAGLPLSQTVDASARKGSWRSSALSLMTSTLVQGGVIASLVIFPLVAMQTPPLPHNAETFHHFVPVVPPPPPPPPKRVEGPRRPPTPTEIDPSRFLDAILHAPVDTPEGILEEIDLFDEGDVGGAFEGVEGGVPGAPPAQPIVGVPDKAEPEPASGPLEIQSAGIRPPQKIHHVNPTYPRVALAARVEGVVELRAIIDEAGNVVNLAVVRSSSPLLERAAMDAVKAWRYEPTYLNGRPYPIIMTVSVAFHLTR